MWSKKLRSSKSSTPSFRKFFWLKLNIPNVWDLSQMNRFSHSLRKMSLSSSTTFCKIKIIKYILSEKHQPCIESSPAGGPCFMYRLRHLLPNDMRRKKGVAHTSLLSPTLTVQSYINNTGKLMKVLYSSELWSNVLFETTWAPYGSSVFWSQNLPGGHYLKAAVLSAVRSV